MTPPDTAGSAGLEVANDQWWQVHLAGQEVSYGNWTIAYNPPPIPARNCDWQFSHNDFDGAEDAGDTRYGTAGSLIDAMFQIDDMEGDAFDCGVCSVADPSWCMSAQPCKHRFDQMVRRKQLDAARAALSRAGKSS